MTSLILSFILTTLLTLILFVSTQTPTQGFPFWKPHYDITNFYSCVNRTSNSQIEFTKGFYAPNYDVKSFTSILNSTAENLRCLAPTLQKPIAIFTPENDGQVQAAVMCAFWHLLQIRVRSGGHDYEGLSYISYTFWQPFVLIDLRKIRKVDIDIKRNTAWVDSGNTIGELYYSISQKSKTHAFTAGIYTDLGVGGHFTGGGYGSLMRKYGLAVDNVLDAEIVNPRGEILNRETMGEDLFWAIRGGGGTSFGVILRWQIQLVTVPEKVTVFSVQRLVNLDTKVNLGILQKWQSAAWTIANELFIRVLMVNVPGSNSVLTIYQALYLGSTSDLLTVMTTSFPELGLVRIDCSEMSWIESVIVNAGFPKGTLPKHLLNGKGSFLNYFKSKSDYVKNPIPNEGLEKMLRLIKKGGNAPLVIGTPYGGKVGEIPETKTAFHNRKYIYKFQYVANWQNASAEAQLEHEAWVRMLYDNMEKYVSSPRHSYVNYRDLDIGKKDARVNCSYPSIWGPKYYDDNYKRLVRVKTMFDPLNMFCNEQSVPPAYLANGCIPFDVGMGK